MRPKPLIPTRTVMRLLLAFDRDGRSGCLADPGNLYERAVETGAAADPARPWQWSVESLHEPTWRRHGNPPDEDDLHDRAGDGATDPGARDRRYGRRTDQLFARDAGIARGRSPCGAPRRRGRRPSARDPDRPRRSEDPAR